MILKKIHFAIDKTTKANASQKALLKRYSNYPVHQSNIIVVIGGDGFMLETLKKLRKFNKPFYGMNTGTYGFLMNKLKTNLFERNALVVKLVDTKDLKSLPVWECQFESGRGHHLEREFFFDI